MTTLIKWEKTYMAMLNVYTSFFPTNTKAMPKSGFYKYPLYVFSFSHSSLLLYKYFIEYLPAIKNMLPFGKFRSVQTKGNRSKPVRRRQMRPALFPPQHLPLYVDLRRYMTPVENQGQMETW